MASDELLHSLASPTRALAAASIRPQPLPGQTIHELFQARHVARNGMIIQPALNGSLQPPPGFRQRTMTAAMELLLDRSQRRSQPFGHALPMDSKPPLASCDPTMVCEAQEVKRFRATFTAMRSSFGRKAAELDQSRLLLVEFQTELGEPSLECFQAGLVSSQPLAVADRAAWWMDCAREGISKRRLSRSRK
jgi:hypothetical protein